MKHLLACILFLPLWILAQDNVLKLSSTAESALKGAKGWIALDSGWKFKQGDDPAWARPEFNDSSWQTIALFDNIPEIPAQSIIWIRLRIIADSTEEQPLVMRLYQSG